MHFIGKILDERDFDASMKKARIRFQSSGFFYSQKRTHLLFNSPLRQHPGEIECAFFDRVIAARGTAVACCHIGFQE